MKNAFVMTGWIAAALVLAPPAFAAPAGTNGLTLAECERLALVQNPLLAIADREQAAALEAAGEARAAWHPTLGVRGGISRWQSHAFLPEGIPATLPSVIGPIDDTSAGAFARYLLVDGGARRAAVARAEALAAAAGSHAAADRQGVLYDVHLAFFQVAVARELRRVAESSLATADHHLGVAKRRQAAGGTTESDVLRAAVAADRARAELIRAESLVRIAAGDLNTVMGRPAETPLAIDAGATNEPPAAEPDIPALMAQAFRNRPEIVAAERESDAAMQGVESAEAGYRPRVYADGNYGWRDDSASLSDEAWFAGVAVEWTAYDGFARRHRLAGARAGASAAGARAERVRLAVGREVWSAAARVREARELLRAAESQVRDARESLRLVEARYEAGAATMTDLLDAQTALTDAEARHVQATWMCRQAQSALGRATGLLEEETGTGTEGTR